MRTERAVGLAAAALALVLLADPALAADSSTEALIDGLNQKLLVVAVPITVLVEGILIYTVLRFRNADEAKPTQENRRLEIFWTVATAIILLWVGFSAFTVLAQEDVTTTDAQPEGDDVTVDVVAARYFWTFDYTQHNVSTSGTLYMPADRRNFLNVTSTDWLHAFHVPEMGLKQDAIPHESNTIMTVPTEPNTTYQGYCAEYCGVGHSGMLFTVEVVPEDRFDDVLADECESSPDMVWNDETDYCEPAPDTNSSAALAAN
jgi:cytochrome c oxidase subunit 2